MVTRQEGKWIDLKNQRRMLKKGRKRGSREASGEVSELWWHHCSK